MTTTTELVRQRLTSQQLSTSSCGSVAQVVQHMGAMQAQDYDMAKWAVGVRLPGSTEQLVEEAMTRGDVLRTHLLRPTWHLVAASDIYWLLDLTAPHVKRLMAGRNRDLGLTEDVLTKSNTLIEQALADHTYLTREELMSRLQLGGINTSDLRASHLMMHAELTGLVCNGPRLPNERGVKQPTYALLRERVPIRQTLSRDEALTKLAKRYFTSHGPASLKDFVWWSGLSVTDARRAIEDAHSLLTSVTVEHQLYWLAQSAGNVPERPDQVQFLPAFDEFMVSYCDRTASLAPEFTRQTITSNGIFKPVIIVNGQVVGSWKRTRTLNSITIDLTLFYALSTDLTEQIHEAANAYRTYAGVEKDWRLRQQS
ncbi:winged helix DNA-binding domain-containing protein [uncultured Fibrella sp.]|uniref:winged helix DNA-binding domain-containing protein n=1 Tax=uncultured Fibrella sp. TaxID=1284596 RepID=UPI0035CB5C1F